MSSQKYKIEIELESCLDEFKLKQFFEDHFDTSFLQVNKIEVKKESEV